MTPKPITDAQIDLAMRNIRAKISEDCDGSFNAHAVQDVIEHCPASGPELLRAMARASLSNNPLPTQDAEKIITNRAKAIYAYIVLQDRVGVERLKGYLWKTVQNRVDLVSTFSGFPQ